MGETTCHIKEFNRSHHLSSAACPPRVKSPHVEGGTVRSLPESSLTVTSAFLTSIYNNTYKL